MERSMASAADLLAASPESPPIPGLPTRKEGAASGQAVPAPEPSGLATAALVLSGTATAAQIPSGLAS